MSDISRIGPGGHGPVGPVNRLNGISLHGVAKPDRVIEVRPDAGPDRVELSDIARFLDKLRSLPDVRLDRITEVRQAIEDGSYESDEKLELAIARMAEQEF